MKIRIIALLFILIGLLTLTSEHYPSLAQEQVTNGRLAFASSIDGDYEIYTINPDGTDRQQLTDNDVEDFNPAWSPDGTRIAFDSYREGFPSKIFIMDADGSNVVRLIDSFGEQPNWSPDGSKIVFSSYQPDGYPDIATVNIDGTELTKVTDDKVYADENPVWSPDGDKIAFVSIDLSNGGPTTPDQTIGGDVYTINPDGTDKTLLALAGINITNISWSPDGNRIAFAYSLLDWIIVIVNADGSNSQIFGLIDVESPLNPNWRYPVWSPDGNKLAVGASYGSDIQILNSDTSGGITISDEKLSIKGLSWQPIFTTSEISSPTPSNQ